jgi:uncharacterized protein YcgI (DUF1989 family)
VQFEDELRWVRLEVAPRTGSAWEVTSGGLIRVEDVEGGQVADVFFVDRADLSDGLSNGRSFDYNGTISLTVGATLFSSRSRALATIVEDDVLRHDFLFTPCSQEMFERQYGVTQPHPNCYANLTLAVALFGVAAETVTVPFNAFMNTAVAENGAISIAAPTSRAGDAITFRADRDVIVAVSACSAPVANAGGSGPLAIYLATA